MNIHRIVKKLQKADAPTVDAVFQAALTRKMELYPQWEFVYLALSREDEASRKQMIRAALQTMEE